MPFRGLRIETGGKTNAELGWPEAVYAPAHQAIEQVFQTGEPQTLEEGDTATRGPEAARYYRAQFLPECGKNADRSKD